MANDRITIDESQMEDMRRAFKQTLEQLENTKREMKSIADTMEGGALLGRTGSAFVEALNDKLCRAIERLTELVMQMDKRVEQALIAYRQIADPTTARNIAG